MTRYACVTALFLLVVYPAAAQERGYLAIDEQDGRVNGHSKFPHLRSSKIPPPLVYKAMR